MKKLFYLPIFISLIFFTSCEKEECVTCVEVNSGYTADEFCGTSSEVSTYEDELTQYNPLYPTQDWVCN